MLAYKPKEVPLLTRIAKSGMFQFLMVVLLGISVTYFVVRTDQPQQWIQKINRFASVSPNASQKAKTEAGIAEDQAEFEAPPPQANTWAARAASPTEMNATTAKSSAAGAGAATALRAGTGDVSPAQTVSATAKVRIQMVEIDYDYLMNNFMNDDMKTLDGDIIHSVSDQKINDANINVLKTDIMDFTSTKNNSVSAGNNVRWIRFTVNVENIEGKIKIFNGFFIKNHPNDTRQITLPLTLAPGLKHILFGPRLLSYFEAETDLANQPPFMIFKSADYRNQKTTFAIIIELQ